MTGLRKLAQPQRRGGRGLRQDPDNAHGRLHDWNQVCALTLMTPCHFEPVCDHMPPCNGRRLLLSHVPRVHVRGATPLDFALIVVRPYFDIPVAAGLQGLLSCTQGLRPQGVTGWPGRLLVR